MLERWKRDEKTCTFYKLSITGDWVEVKPHVYFEAMTVVKNAKGKEYAENEIDKKL